MRKFAILALASLALAGCHEDMWLQPKLTAQDSSDFFVDGKADRPPVEGSVEFGEIREGDPFYTGYFEGRPISEFPKMVDADVLERGKERFEIFCSHCHGDTGRGDGMIAERGYELARPVASYHTDRLREMPVGHFFDVITNGYGTMYPFSDRIPAEDRWAIVAYIRAMQATHMSIDEVPSDAREELLAEEVAVDAEAMAAAGSSIAMRDARPMEVAR